MKRSSRRSMSLLLRCVRTPSRHRSRHCCHRPPHCSRASRVTVAPGACDCRSRRYRLQLNSGAQFELQIPIAGILGTVHRARAGRVRHAPACRRAGLHAQLRLASSRSGDRLHRIDRCAGSSMPARSTTGCLTCCRAAAQDILRMKGVLNLKGEIKRYVFHGVHMMFDGQLERAWSADAPRRQPPGVHRPQSRSPRARGRLRILRRMSAPPGRLQARESGRAGRLSGRCGLVGRRQGIAGRRR